MLTTIINILIGIGVLTGLGLVIGFGLSVASKVFMVEIDPIEENIFNALPGANCGACGYPGCSGYAVALAKDNSIPINLCSPGGKTTLDKLAAILSRDGVIGEHMVAKVCCLGDDAIAKKDFIFNGEDDCFTVYSFYKGEKSCKYGCVGKGSCIKVCPVNAINRDPLNRVWIDSNLCIGCEKCVTVCPPKVIKMFPLNGGHFVACSSHDNSKTVKENCKKGCIGCKICEKATDNPDRIVVTDNLAIINYNNPADLHTAAIKCPANVIVPIKTQKNFMIEILNKQKPT